MIISTSNVYIKGLYLPPTTAPALSDLCDTDGKDDVDEYEGVDDVLVVDTPVEEGLVVDGEAVLKLMLTTVVGSRDAVVVVTVAVVGDADAVDSGSEDKILQ